MISERKDITFEFDSDWLYREGNRLDGSFYLNDATKAIISINKKNLKVDKIGNFASKIFLPNRFRRIYIKDANRGIKFLTTTEVLKYEHEDVNIISNVTPGLSDYLLSQNCVLVSRSGTIGNTSFVWNQIKGFVGTEDLIRIIPKKDYYAGFIYAYLSSKVGISLLKSGTFGSVVDHIEPKHIHELPIILLSDKEQKDIHNNIMNVFNWRYKSNLLMEKSLSKLYKTLELPTLKQDDEFIYKSNIKSWEVEGFSNSLRFEANYYNTYFMNAIRNLKKLSNLVKLEEVAKIVNPPRSSRVYVNEGKGIPYYSGSNLSQFCKNGVKNLAKVHKQLEEVKIEEGWTLVTRVGTTGLVYFVDKLKSGKCASDNILRIIPNKEKILPEYLYLFLRSEYGKVQFSQIKTGSVQDYIPEEYAEKILIPLPDIKIQEEIISDLKETFKLRESAELLEDECKCLFDNLVFT